MLLYEIIQTYTAHMTGIWSSPFQKTFLFELYVVDAHQAALLL